jgi:transglutaminase-like putative cysteine protease
MASLSSLIAVLAYGIAMCGLLPLFPWLETTPRLFLAAGMAVGIWQDLRGPWTLKNWIFNAAIVPVFLFYAIQFSRANPVQPVVSVLAIMLAVRLAGLKNARHYLQISALSLFCLASSSLFDLSPSFLFYLVVMLLMVAVLLVLVTFYSQDQRMLLPRADLRKVLLAGLAIPLASLPLLLLFFPILPRTQMPLWNFVAASTARPSGFSDQVEPGSSSAVGESRAAVFRAEMERQPQQQLYWRGTVFNRIEGSRWIRVEPPSEHIIYRGRRIIQTVYPEPGSSRALPALDAPAAIMLQRSRQSSDGVYESQGRVGKRFSYRAESVSEAVLPVNGDIRRLFYLAVPDGQSTRIRQLAANIRRLGNSDAVRLEQLEQYFRNGGFSYSKTGLPTGEQALEQFLFEKKQGHCEFFAASFALILRSAGVPARIVGGYLGGDYNDLGGYYMVSEEMAHVWVEAFISGKGWVRIDPSSFAQNAGAVWGGSPRKSLLRQFRMTLDSLNFAWNSTVINYDFERQVGAVKSAGRRLQGIEVKAALKTALRYLLIIAGVAAVYSIIFYRKRLFPSREERLLRALYRRVGQDFSLKVERGRVGLFELADRTGNPAVCLFAETYASAVYRDRPLTDEECVRLKSILEQIQKTSNESKSRRSGGAGM